MLKDMSHPNGHCKEIAAAASRSNNPDSEIENLSASSSNHSVVSIFKDRLAFAKAIAGRGVKKDEIVNTSYIIPISFS
jgi:hypothetical protein